MNMIFCSGIMPPELDWNKKVYNPNKPRKEWLQFVVEDEHDVIMQIPKFPHAHFFLMQYDEWEKIMDRQDINSDTTIVAHSAGGGFILKYMALHPELKVKQIILVAPWLDAENVQPNKFYHGFDLNNDIVKQTYCGCDLMISDDDAPYILSSYEKIASCAPDIRIHKFSGHGHFVSETLPEIIPLIKF